MEQGRLDEHRRRIDQLDDQIVELLGTRFAVVREVAALKGREGIPARLPDRIEEVCARNAARGSRLGLDPEFVRGLYATIIDEACRLEDTMMESDN